MALRLALVQPPKMTSTPSSSSSLRAFSAKVGQSLAPSSTIGSIWRPSTPPLALISSIAINVESRTVVSLMDMVPLSECKMPTLIGPSSCALTIGTMPTVNKIIINNQTEVFLKAEIRNIAFPLMNATLQSRKISG